MKPPHLAIVTSMSKGMTLYTHIHLLKDKFYMNKTTIIAQQISQVIYFSSLKNYDYFSLKRSFVVDFFFYIHVQYNCREWDIFTHVE